MQKECITKIRAIYRGIAAFEADLQKHLGLNINEAMLLCLVADHENISSGELAEEMALTPSNTSKVIAALERMALIRRHTCKEDKRCMKFAITKKGAELLALLNCEAVRLPENLQQLSNQFKPNLQ